MNVDTKQMLPSTARKMCQARTKSGTPCQATPQANGWCFSHDPALRAERKAARAKGGRARHGRQLARGQHDPVTLGTPEDVRRLLEVAINDCLQLENSVSRARAVGTLALAALKVFEVGEHAERLAAIEEALRRQGAL